MSRMKYIGADIGNDALKITDENGRQYEVMNIVSPGYKRRVIGKEEGKVENLLDVNIIARGKDLGRYFVGGLAFKESAGDYVEKTAEDVKAIHEDTMILLLTGLAYSLYEPGTKDKTENIALGTALPTEEYFQNEYYKCFEEKLSGEYKIKFNSEAFEGAQITMNIIDRDIQPEGPVGMIASMYEMDGRIKKGKENMQHETHLGIFIGSVTTEICVMENGEFNPKGFAGIPFGISEPLDKIADELQNTYNIEMPRHKLDYIIREEKTLKSKTDEDITEILTKIKEVRFDNFGKLLINRINKKLTLKGINTSFIDAVDLGGGGALVAPNEVKKYLKIKNISMIEDPRFANSKGCLISIKLKRSNIESAAAEVFEE